MTIRLIGYALLLATPLWGSVWLQDSRPKSAPAANELRSASGKKIPAGARILSYKIW